MSLAKIDSRHRGILRLHGWLLMLWACTVGGLTSAFLLHVLKLHSMGLRYAIGAGMVYFIGFVLGGKWYASWWNEQRYDAENLPRHATPEEQLEYDQSEAETRKKIQWLDWGGDISGLGDDPLSALILVIWLIWVAIAVLFLVGYLPYFATELLASYMAEIVLEFVIGGLLVRRVLKPKALDDYWKFMVRKTWLAGLFFISIFGGLGFLIQQANPEAKTIFQALLM